MIILKDAIIGDVVAQDYRAAQVFSNYGIDFCCRGNRSITEVCEKDNLDQNQILDELTNVLTTKESAGIDFNDWPLDLMVDYIEKTHHRYVEAQVPLIKNYLDKICDVHGVQHPELFKIRALFVESAKELTTHMKKEELILFPQIKKMVQAKIGSKSLEKSAFGTIKNPIATMMAEHDNEGVRFREIAKLSNNYTPPSDGCNTYKVTFSLIKEFEQDLHKHIHLENNILFKRALVLEHKISS